MTRLPGSVDLVRHDDQHLARLARVLVGVHWIRPEDGLWPDEHESWAFESKLVAPPWATDEGLYRDAFARVREAAPSYRRTFIHRDFYPANVLWRGGKVTGVVDWNRTASGPADIDVAHCSSNLAGLHGVECALAFRKAYVDAGGVLAEDADASRYWQLIDILAFLPDPSGAESGATGTAMTAIVRAHGRPDLTVEMTRSNREDLLRAILR